MNVIYETYFEFSHCFKYCNFEIIRLSCYKLFYNMNKVEKKPL